MPEALLKAIPQRLRKSIIGMCLLLFCTTKGLAAVDICDRPDVSSHASFGALAGNKAKLDDGLGEVEQEDYSVDLGYQFENDWSLGVGHRYTIFRFGPIEPQTNGHVHTLFVPVHRVKHSEGKSFRLSVAPALSASSNVVKDAGEYDADAMQLLAAALWHRALNDTTGLSYGVCGDHRFGSYRIYPLLSFNWQPRPDWTIKLGFPTASLSYQATRRLNSSLRFGPNGNEWYVKDKTLRNASQFIHESYLLEWALDWQAYKRFVITAGIGWQFHNRYELTLLDGSQVRLSSDSFTRVGASIAWRF